MADRTLHSDTHTSPTEGFDLVVGRLESDLPHGAVTTSVNSSGIPESCAGHYCCLTNV